MGDRKVPTFKAWAEKDGPFCGQTKLAINQKTNEGEDTWSMIPTWKSFASPITWPRIVTHILFHKLFMI